SPDPVDRKSCWTIHRVTRSNSFNLRAVDPTRLREPRFGFSRSHRSKRGELREKEHVAARTKTVVGSPGTMTPTTARATAHQQDLRRSPSSVCEARPSLHARFLIQARAVRTGSAAVTRGRQAGTSIGKI